jgi:CheY-like chemotaxis protein
VEDTVLVVEDEDEARSILTQILELEGFRVHGCANGAEALIYLGSSNKPCLIILDLLMPVMDGRQFRAATLRNRETADIPVVVVTALDPSDARDLKAVGVLKKPVNVGELLNLVRANC